jgi:hypothetical protein
MKPARHLSIAFAVFAVGATAAEAQVTARQVDAGLGLLPPDARAGAEILAWTDAGIEVIRPGSNGWTCRIRPQSDRFSASCYQNALAGKLELERVLEEQAATGAEVREALAAALQSGRVSIPRGAVELSGSGPLGDGMEVPREMTRYVYLYFPFETADRMGMPGSDPGDGSPWLHHGGTSDAHLMWPRPTGQEDPPEGEDGG